MEKLSDYLLSHRQGMLGRIFLAQKLEESLKTIVKGQIKVIIKGKTIQLVCAEPALARRLELDRRSIEKIISELTQTKSPNFTLKIRVKS